MTTETIGCGHPRTPEPASSLQSRPRAAPTPKKEVAPKPGATSIVQAHSNAPRSPGRTRVAIQSIRI